MKQFSLKIFNRTFKEILLFVSLTFFCGIQAQAAPTLQTTSTAQITSESQSIDMLAPAGTSVGDLLIAAISTDGPETLTTPSGWILIQQGYRSNSNNSNGATIAVFYRITDASDIPLSTVYTFSWGSNEQAVGAILRYSGADASNPIDVSAINTTFGNGSATTPNVTTTVDDTTVLRILSVDTAVNVTSPAGHTQIINSLSTSGDASTLDIAGTTQATAGQNGNDDAFTHDGGLETYATVTLAIRPLPIDPCDPVASGNVDTDGDGYSDVCDLDDDNDGILDIIENPPVQTNSYTGGDGGSVHTDTYTYGSMMTVLVKLDPIDNSFNLDIEGVTLLTDGRYLDLQDPSDASGSRLVFADNSTMDTPWISNSNGLPRVTVVVDQTGLVSIYGTRTTTSTTVELMHTEDGALYNSLYALPGSRTITVTNPDGPGPDAINFTITVSPSSTDLDGDGITNDLDLDSDNDGIPDNVEAQTASGYLAPNGDAGPGNSGVDTAYTGGLTAVDTDSDGIPDYLDSDSDGDDISDCEEGLPADTTGKDCTITIGDVGSNGLADWAETGGTDQGYSDVNGIVDTPLSVLQDILDISDSEVDYRQFNTCGPSRLALTQYQWKIISFGCDTGTNSIDALLSGSLGTYGTNWIMWEQVAYTGSNSADLVPMDATDTVQPGKGYWIITDNDVNMTVDLGANEDVISETPVVPKTDFTNVTGTAFDDVMGYSLPNSQNDRKTKVILGNPFRKKFQLSDMHYNTGHNGVTYYPMGDTANIGDYVEFTVYAHDSTDRSSANDQYIAIPTDTPGFTDRVDPMMGFFLLIKVDPMAPQSNDVIFPLEK
jgi:hypothetical protein